LEKLIYKFQKKIYLINMKSKKYKKKKKKKDTDQIISLHFLFFKQNENNFR